MMYCPGIPHVPIAIHFLFPLWVLVSQGTYVLSDGTLGAVGVSGRAGYMSYVPLRSSLGTLGELGALCPPMEFGGGVTYRWLVGC